MPDNRDVTTESESCLFCKIAAKKIPSTIVHEDDELVGFRDISPQAPSHVLFIPKKHISAVTAMESTDAELVGKLIAAAGRFAREGNLGDFRLVVNNGPGAGQSVFHIHVHMMAGRPFAWPPG